MRSNISYPVNIVKKFDFLLNFIKRKKKMFKCAICLEKISEKNKSSLPCNHNFHTTCLMKSCLAGNSSCPLCRNQIIDKLEIIVPEVEVNEELSQWERLRYELTKESKGPYLLIDSYTFVEYLKIAYQNKDIEDFNKLCKKYNNIYNFSDESTSILLLLKMSIEDI
jgi:hypothetical protein